MTSKELLERLQEMKIPAKNHASTLIEPYVDKIRKELGPEIDERKAAAEKKRQEEEAKELKKREAEEAKRKKEEETRLQAEEEERKARQVEEEERKRKAAAEAEKKRQEEEAERLAREEAEREAAETREAEEKEEADRYRQMAREAEATERQQRILSEAQAVATAAAKASGRPKKKSKKAAPEPVEEAPVVAVEEPVVPVCEGGTMTLTEGATVGEFADAAGVASTDIIKRLMLLGEPLTVNQPLSTELVELLSEDMGVECEIIPVEAEFGEVIEDAPEDLEPRPPVVTVMGHVDHGKTSLLDAIRETGVAEAEAGGITQHIGASVVFKNDKQITFIDTPGHEAFTAMRARGADLTDVAILVVAADDGVMPQTVEALDHAKAAGVPIIVAVNKIDKPDADANRVRQELTEHEIVPEDWGGDTVFVDVSAKQRINIEDLLEMILLVAEVQELKANPRAHASGIVVEAKLDRGRGPVATVLVQRGTLVCGDAVVAGTGHGRVRALIDPLGHNVDEAKPADPVEILGLSSLPAAGDEFRVTPDERAARDIAEERSLKKRLLAHEKKAHISLDDLFARIQEGEVKDLNLVLKADTQGSIEAIKDALDKIDQDEVRIQVLRSGVGGITEADVTLADASDAIVIGFSVRPEPGARDLAEKTNVDVRLYTVIYQLVDDINAARVGMLAPEFHEEDIARVEVRETFRVPKVGAIAGCYVVEGEITRGAQVRIVRDGTIVYDGRIGSLRRFKDDVKSVKAGYECGIGIKDFQDVKVGDVIEAYKTVEVAREA
jgi:translation initiation factor IF-2